MASLVADALTTVAEVETLVGLSSGADTTKITNSINHATKRILTYIDRTIVSTARTEFYDGTGTPILVLRHYPIIGNPALVNIDSGRDFLSATDLTVDDDYLVDSDDDADNPAILRRLSRFTFWPRGYQNIKVTYTAGFASTPQLLENTATAFAAYLYGKGPTRGNIRTNLGGVLIDEDIRHPSGIPQAFRGDLDPFVRSEFDDQFDNWDVPDLL